jgi:hypothetical protein
VGKGKCGEGFVQGRVSAGIGSLCGDLGARVGTAASAVQASAKRGRMPSRAFAPA